MGRNLLLNIADHGFAVAGYDRNKDKVEALRKEGGNKKVTGVESIETLVQSLESPRAVLLLVPAGEAVDSVISELKPHLEKGDLIIDGGNSRFSDTDRRMEELRDSGYLFLGMGVSGGESGARHGPSLMPGGPREAYDRVKDILEAAAAKVDGDPCVEYLGPRSAGHYVKMAHNGIEYAFMQLLAESYDLLKRAAELNNDELHDLFARWNSTELSGFLVEITAAIFKKEDDLSGSRLVDCVLDAAEQKGTGAWASEDAMSLGVPIPTIDVAVAMRSLSSYKEIRSQLSSRLKGPRIAYRGKRETFVKQLGNALYAGQVLAFAQGMALLRSASEEYRYGLNLEDVARIWRGGCIIRAALLEDFRAAYRKNPDLSNPLLANGIARKVQRRQSDLRRVVKTAVSQGIPAAGFASALAYYDSFRSAWLPANLIQAQRDCFGAHTYRRNDREGTFHSEWTE